MKATPSQVAEALLLVKGSRLDFERYLPTRTIYDVAPKTLVLIAGRQVSKTVSVAANIVLNSIIKANFISLYISPLSQQTSRFSSLYLDPFFSSPVIKKHFKDSDSKKNVYEKTFSNGSKVFLSYVEVEADADRVRGLSIDSFYGDEIQDISADALPVVEETLSASKYGFRRYSGTAKTTNNTLTLLFKSTNQCFWTVKCPSCNTYNVPNTFENCLAMCASDAGPCCMKCGYILNMKTGEWIASVPRITDKVGFSLPQLIIPYRNEPEKWKELREKINSYPMAKLSNEVFGLPIGVGGRILSENEAIRCCNPNWRAWDKGWMVSTDRPIISVVVGVDWSVTASEKSFTVISVMGFDYTGKLYLLYSERINGIDILEQVKRVQQLYTQFNAQAIGSDRGVGVLQCELLAKELGPDKVFPINYVNAKIQIRYDAQGRFYSADRTTNMHTIFMKMKIGRPKFECPAYDVTSNPFWNDCLSIYEEESLSGKLLFRHDEDVPDDSFHSVVFGYIAFEILTGNFVYTDDPKLKENY
jgi:hypothetical protein